MQSTAKYHSLWRQREKRSSILLLTAGERNQLLFMHSTWHDRAWIGSSTQQKNESNNWFPNTFCCCLCIPLFLFWEEQERQKKEYLSQTILHLYVQSMLQFESMVEIQILSVLLLTRLTSQKRTQKAILNNSCINKAHLHFYVFAEPADRPCHKHVPNI